MDTMSRFYRYLWIVLLVAILVPTLFGTQDIHAHGGVIIDSGFTPHFEWLVSIDPYPIRTGQALVTLLVFDLDNYNPVNDLQVQLAQAAPGTTRPCCDADELSEPLTLMIDPAIYPGDYSAIIPLDQAGDWALQFTVEGGDRSFTIIVPVAVAASPPGQEAVVSLTPDIAATSTAFAQNVQEARQQNSPLGGMNSPLVGGNNPSGTFAFFGLSWWLWGIAALIPLIMGWLLLRRPAEDELLDAIEDDEEDDVEMSTSSERLDNGNER